MVLFHIIYMTFIKTRSLNTHVFLHVHIISREDFPNEQNPTCSHDRSLAPRDPPLRRSPSPSLSLLRIRSYSISKPRPIYLIPSLSCNWNFYWDEGDNSCKCANWRLAPGRDVKPSSGIKKSRVWNAAHFRVMYHAAPLGHSRLADCGAQLSLSSLLLSAVEDMPHY